VLARRERLSTRRPHRPGVRRGRSIRRSSTGHAGDLLDRLHAIDDFERRVERRHARVGGRAGLGRRDHKLRFALCAGHGEERRRQLLTGVEGAALTEPVFLVGDLELGGVVHKHVESIVRAPPVRHRKRSCIEAVARLCGSAYRRHNRRGAKRPYRPREQTVPVTAKIDARYLEALGPLRPLIDDDSLTEIMVNGPDMVYVERKGKILLTDVRFDDEAHLVRVIETIVSSVGRRVDARTPLCDARLLDGSRVNAAVPPVALDGPILTIRKFSKDPYQVSDLIGFGTLTQESASFIQACVLARANIIVSGGTGTGKTTLLNVCSGFIPIDERIVTIEDAAELQLHQEHVCRLESRPPDVNGEGRIAIRELVINSLRMRPDRIVVGECRGGEALDMLQAMNTGHDGSLTTIHANTPRETLGRLETLVLMAGMDLPVKAIRQQISAAINLVIQLARLKDGSRKVVAINEVIGMEGEVITMQEIFKFESKGADPQTGKIVGDFNSTGIRPRIIDRLFDMGIPLPTRLAQMFPDRRQLSVDNTGAGNGLMSRVSGPLS